MVANPVSDTSLKVRVENREDQLFVTWNSHLPFLQSAKYGIVSIDDGAAHEDLNLSAADIAKGSLSFKPASDDVTFRFEIHGKEGITTTAIVRAPERFVASAAPRPEPVRPSPPSAVSSQTTQEHRVRHTATRTLKLKSTAPLSTTAESRHTIQISGMPEVSLEGIQAPASPPGSSIATNAPDFVPPSSDKLARSKPAVHDVALTLPVKPAVTRSLAYIPPRPLKQVLPSTRAFGSTLVRQPEHVDVELTIDEKGRVREASIVKNGASAAAPLLNQQALAAARQWVFEPAKMQGKSVPSQHTIHFFFHPDTQ